MSVYRFKVTFEDDEEVYRTIEIKPGHTFRQFHDAIQAAIGFDNSKTATFFMSNDNWRKGKEIPFAKFDLLKLATCIEDPHQKIIYIFDPESNWTLLIELLKITDEQKGVAYPRCEKTHGVAPRQYKATSLPLVENDEFDDDTDESHSDQIFDNEERIGEDADDLEGEEGLEGEQEPEEAEGLGDEVEGDDHNHE